MCEIADTDRQLVEVRRHLASVLVLMGLGSVKQFATHKASRGHRCFQLTQHHLANSLIYASALHLMIVAGRFQ